MVVFGDGGCVGGGGVRRIVVECFLGCGVVESRVGFLGGKVFSK